MNHIIEDLGHEAQFPATRHWEINLQVAPGEYFVLLGPSGSGKTLLLECLCGLNRIQSGRILIGDSDVTDLEPRRRGVGYLPQDYALFPHRTVRQNIAFGLASRRLPRATREKRVDELLDAALLTMDQEERKEYYFEMQQILAEEVPAPILYFRQGTGCWNKRLHEFEFYAVNYRYNSGDWWVER